jgi:hypothetical protein
VPVASTTTPLVDGTAAVGVGTTWARADHVHPVPPQAIGDNRILNGGFAVNQRVYVSGTALPAAPATAAYGHDRWKAGAAGGTYTFTAAVPDTTVTITVGTLTQIIEALMIEGGVYTLSWTGTAQARVYQGTPTGSYATSPITTASLTAGTNTTVEFNTGTLTRVKLESGAVATPFNRHSVAKLNSDCQRYFIRYAQVMCSGWAATGAPAYNTFWMPTSMRASPTVTVGAPTYSNGSALTMNAVDNAVLRLQVLATATGYAYGIAVPLTLDAEL